ncbi:MAG: zinc dependent phospholipase C family protein [Dehalococcoidia bacterium]|nr:zinc dependent phospholipase C family protein [Dehalococcoidia bacterium]
MPPICTHLAIAHDVSARLRHPVIDQNRGYYYLGSTAPDMRLFMKAGREQTHFLSLNSDEGESGVWPMLEAYPELGNTNLSAATRAFIAGYLSHLVTDEAWIYRIYRPFFGEASGLKGTPIANLLDRLLQFELDRRARMNGASISMIRSEISSPVTGIGVRFIDSSNLKRWQEFVSIATSRRAHREDFRWFAEKYLACTRQISPEEQASFFASFDSRLQEVLEIVPEEQIESFREASIRDSVRVAKEYLG